MQCLFLLLDFIKIISPNRNVTYICFFLHHDAFLDWCDFYSRGTFRPKLTVNTSRCNHLAVTLIVTAAFSQEKVKRRSSSGVQPSRCVLTLSHNNLQLAGWEWWPFVTHRLRGPSLTPPSYLPPCSSPPLLPAFPTAGRNFQPGCRPPVGIGSLRPCSVGPGLDTSWQFDQDDPLGLLRPYDWVWWFEQFEHPGENAVSFPGLPSFPTMLLWAGGPSWFFGRWPFLPMADELDLTIHFASTWCFLCLFFSDTIFTSAGWEHSCTPSCAIIHLSTHGLHFASSLIPHQCRGFVFEGCNEQSGKICRKAVVLQSSGQVTLAGSPSYKLLVTGAPPPLTFSPLPPAVDLLIVPLLCHWLTLSPLL